MNNLVKMATTIERGGEKTPPWMGVLGLGGRRKMVWGFSTITRTLLGQTKN
jgi:hypothetical protein